MRVRLLHDRILARRLEEAEKKSGLILPGTAKEKPLEGKVDGAVTEVEMKETPSASATGN